MSYDIKFRQQVLKIRMAEKLSLSKVAQRFGISKQTVYNWTKRIKEKKQRIKPCTKINMNSLADDVRLYPNAYQYERSERLRVSVRCVGYALKRLGVSYKKNTQSSQSQIRRTLCILPGGADL